MYRYEDEELINNLKSLAAELGHAPTAREFKDSGYIASAVTYVAHFGSWSNALRLAGLTPYQKGFPKVLDEKEMLANLKRLSKDLGHPPTVRECDECSYTCSSQYYRKKYGSWGGALSAAKIKKKDLLADLQRLAKELGRAPGIKECNACEYTASSTTYIREYGHWNDALAAAGLQKITNEDAMIANLQRLSGELGHVPSESENDRCPYTPSHRTFCGKFGSWKDTLKKANLI